MISRSKVALEVSWCAATLLALHGCIIEPPPEETEAARNACHSDRDCTTGVCDIVSRLCSRRAPPFESLLVVIEPPQSDRDFGGRDFVQRLRFPADGLPLQLTLPNPTRFGGQIELWLTDCTSHPLMVQLKPRSSWLGLDLPLLETPSETESPVLYPGGPKVADVHLNIFQFSSVPTGRYDLYWTDYWEQPPTTCSFASVPQLARDVTVPGVAFSFSQLSASVETSPVRELRVTLPPTAGGVGWTVDAVHNITGERLSTRAVFAEPPSEVDADMVPDLETTLRIGSVIGKDYSLSTPDGTLFPAGLLVRLTPPQGAVLPVLLYSLSNLVVSSTAPSVVLPALPTFSPPLTYRAWVWGDGDPSRPLSGVVRFQAITLTDVRGAQVSFSRTARIGEGGGLEVALLPGEYAVDIVPDSHLDYGLTRATVKVAAGLEGDAGAVRAGSLFEVPVRRRIRGRVTAEDGIPLGTEVRVAPTPRVGLVQSSRFRSRDVSTRVDDRGRFDVAIDCSGCEVSTPPRFDIVVRPPADLGFGWVVIPSAEVPTDLELRDLRLRPPYVVNGQLSYQSGRPFPSARVQAYAMLDPSGGLVEDETTPDCIDLEPGSTTQCVSRVVLLAETVAEVDGRFRLLLPRELSPLRLE